MDRMPRKRLLLLGSLLAFSGIGCDSSRAEVGDYDDVPDDQRYGGTVVIGSYGELQPMNRLVSSDYNTNMIQREMLYMPLVKYDEALEPVPWLAERWDTVRVAPDTLELTFHLRRDISWHDGTPTTAHDVLFTFRTLQIPETGFPNPAYFEYYAPDAVVIGDHEIRFRLRPHAEFLEPWLLTPPMPAHLLRDVPPAQMVTHPFGHQNPVGNGPFRFLRRVVGQEWVFEANDDFPEALGGRPRLDRVVWRNIPEQTTLLTELLTGRLDVYMAPNPEHAGQIVSARDVELLQHDFRQWVYIAWNTRLPQFSDARVRRALTMAIDRQQIVDGLVHGYGEVGRGTVWAGHFAFDPDDPQGTLPHDLEAARQLLSEAGWNQGADGVMRNGQGVPFSFTIITNHGNDTRKDILDFVQAQLRPLGIQAQPRLVEWTTMLDQLRGDLNADGVRERQFDAVVSSWVDAFRKDDADQLHSRGLNMPYQYVGYSHPRSDMLLDTLPVLMSREESRPFWREYDRFMVQEAPYTVLYYPHRINGVRTRLQNVSMDTRGELVNVTQWWLPAEHR
jgi:peptide/nickel transport system substrate-binding protein